MARRRAQDASRMPRQAAAFAMLAFLIFACAMGISTTRLRASEAQPAQSSHVLVVVLENKGFDQIIGSNRAPYLNSLVPQGALATNYHGVTHPSLPNYLAMTSGDTWGVTTDCTTCYQNVENLADQLDAAGLTWKSYQEGFPMPSPNSATGGCFLGSQDRYAQKHDPFIYYDSVRNSPDRCARIVDFGALAADLAAGTLPQFAFVIPDQCHDMHDCSVAAGDGWLSTFMPSVLDALNGPDDLIVIVFDEDDYRPGPADGGQVALIMLGPRVRAGYTLPAERNHYDLLATIEDLYSLPRLGNAAEAAGLADALSR